MSHTALVKQNIGAAIRRLDEAITLGAVKPFDMAGDATLSSEGGMRPVPK
jgi:hypothetical protein